MFGNKFIRRQEVQSLVAAVAQGAALCGQSATVLKNH